MAELGGSALFGARFRENAARALLIPRAYPGKRTPLWQQRLKAQTLLEVARATRDFPIVLETYRECLRDVLDLPGLVELLAELHRRELALVEVETRDRLAVRLLAAVRLRRDLHVRGRRPERRAARGGAVAGPRPAARAARPGGAARADRSRARWRASRHELQRRSERTQATRPRRPARRAAPRRRPRRRGGCGARARRARLPAMLAELARERRAVRVRIGGEQRWIAADDAGLYRDALGVAPAGRPARRVPRGRARRARRGSLRRYARTHGPFTDRGAARRATASTLAPCSRSLERDGELVRGELRPGGSRARVVRRRGAAPPAPGLAGRPARGDRAGRPARARRASCRPGRASTATRRRAPASTACARCSCRCRASRCRPRCGSATCCRAASAPTRRPGLDAAVRERRAGLGRRRRARARTRPGGAVLPRGRRRCSGRRRARRQGGAGRARRRTSSIARAAGRRRRASSPTCSPTWTSRRRSCRRRCGISSGRRGDQRRVRAAARAAPDARAGQRRDAPGARARRFAGRARAAPAPRPRSRVAGR